MTLKRIVLAIVGLFVGVALLGVYFANRLLRVDFWDHRPGATALPPPKDSTPTTWVVSFTTRRRIWGLVSSLSSLQPRIGRVFVAGSYAVTHHRQPWWQWFTV